METESNSFNGTTSEDHNLNYSWDISLPLNRNPNFPNYGYTSAFSDNKSLCDNKYSSSEFSMSKTCYVKFKMICQERTQANKDKYFKIGLKREDSDQRAVNTFCFVKIIFSNSCESKKDSFEFNFSNKGKEYYTNEIRLTTTTAPNILFGSNISLTHVKLHITGLIVAQNCCKTRRERNESMDKNISQLQQDFKTFFKRKETADVSLNIRNERLAAHKFVLTARSPVFLRMFSQDLTERQQNSIQIDDIEKSVMEAFLLFLYTGALEDRGFSTVFELYSVADKYEVTTLFDTCRGILISYVTIPTVIAVLKLADMHSDDEMKDFAVKYICDNFSKVETTAEWGELLDSNPRLASYTLRRVSRNISK